MSKKRLAFFLSLWFVGILLPSVAVAQSEPLPTPDAEGIIYIDVQSNDSLWSIAARAGLSLAELLELNGLGEDAVIQPGDRLIVGRVTPMPTETPEPTVTATLPPPTPRPTEGPNKTAVCLLAFDDTNQNGIQDADEPLKAGVVFTVFNDAAVVGNYVTDAVSEPYCLEGLQPGNYQITRSVDANETLTTDGNWTLLLAKDAVLTQAFGSFEGTAVSPIDVDPTVVVPTSPPAAIVTPEPIQSESPQLDTVVGEEADVVENEEALWERPFFWLTLGLLLLLGAVLLWWFLVARNKSS
ncbi:MAG: LysM peptidoglycan-binding domain-containing protein [Chloroflexota bacterium]